MSSVAFATRDIQKPYLYLAGTRVRNTASHIEGRTIVHRKVSHNLVPVHRAGDRCTGHARAEARKALYLHRATQP